MSHGKLKAKWSLRKKITWKQIAPSNLWMSASLQVTAMTSLLRKRVALGAVAPFLLLTVPLLPKIRRLDRRGLKLPRKKRRRQRPIPTRCEKRHKILSPASSAFPCRTTSTAGSLPEILRKMC